MTTPSNKTLIAINALSNYVRFGLTIACTFLLTPVLVKCLGATDYGMWTLLLCIVGYLELMDFGLTTGVMRFISAAGSQNLSRKNRLTNSLFVAACSLALITILVGGLVAGAFGVCYAGQSWIALLVLLLTAKVAVGIPMGVFMGALFGEMQIWVINVIRGVSILLFSIGAYWLLSKGYGIMTLAILYTIVYSIESVTYLIAARSRLHWLHISSSSFDGSVVREVVGFCLSSFTSNSANVVLARTDPLIVSACLSLPLVALYAVPMRITEQLFQLSKQLINVFSPWFAQLHSGAQLTHVREAYLTCTKLAWGLMVAVVAPAMLFSRAGLSLWIGPEFADAGPILVILLAASLLRVLQESAASVLSMTGRHTLVARLAILSAGTNIVLSLLFVQIWGLYGVALATLICILVFGSSWSTWATCRHLRIPAWQFVRNVILTSLIPVSVQVACLIWLNGLIAEKQLAHLFIYSCVSGTVYIITYTAVSLRRNERRILRRHLSRLQVRFNAWLAASPSKQLKLMGATAPVPCQKLDATVDHAELSKATNWNR